MKNKFLVFSAIICATVFANAQDSVATAPKAENLPVAEATVQHPQETPTVAEQQNATTDDSTKQEQNTQAQPVKFYYSQAQAQESPKQDNAAKPATTAIIYEAPSTSAPDLQNNQAQTPQPIIKRELPTHPKQQLHYGIMASIGRTTLGGGDNEDLDNGLIWNAGAFTTLPVSEYIFNFEIGAQFIYRTASNSYKVFNNITSTYDAKKNKITSYTLGIPLQMNINAGRSQLVYFSIGTEIEVPLYNNLRSSTNGNTVLKKDLLEADFCAPMFWNIDFGIGVNATKNFAIYARANLGISDMYDDLYVIETNKSQYWSYIPYDFTIGTKLFF